MSSPQSTLIGEPVKVELSPESRAMLQEVVAQLELAAARLEAAQARVQLLEEKRNHILQVESLRAGLVGEARIDIAAGVIVGRRRVEEAK